MLDVSYGTIINWISSAISVAKKAQALLNQVFSEEAWDKFKKFKKIVVEGTQVIIDGVAYIVDDIIQGVKKFTGKKRRAIGLGVSLIAGRDCVHSVFDESLDVLDKTAEMFFWMAATNFTHEIQVPCKNIGSAFKNVEKFLETCIDSSDPVYNDTGKLLGRTLLVINRLCTDQNYQRQLETCGCACNCTQQHSRFLEEVGLVHDEEEDTHHERAEYDLPNVEDVCLVTQKLSQCEKEICSKQDDDKAEIVLAKSVDSFCKRHEDWEPARPAGIVPTEAPRKRASTTKESKSGTALLEAAFCYLSLIVCMII